MLTRPQRRQSIVIFLLGISSGLPILLVFGTLSVWLREAGIERSTISFISWIGLSYGFKFIWAPLIDSSRLYYLTSWLGRRRSWLFLAQIGIIASLVIMAISDPKQSQLSLTTLIIGGVLLSFFSATQDTVIDAYRIEIANSDMQSLLAGVVVAGYRVGMIIAGAGALELTDYIAQDSNYLYSAWRYAYFFMAIVMGLAIVLTLNIVEPKTQQQSANNDSMKLFLHFLGVFATFVLVFTFSHSLTENNASGFVLFLLHCIRFTLAAGSAIAVGYLLAQTPLLDKNRFSSVYIAPFTSFFEQYGKLAVSLLLVICLYRCSDIVMGVIAKVFYIDMGYSKAAIARISFSYGLVITIAGGIAGGLLAIRYGLISIYLIGALVGPLSNLVFIYIAQTTEPSLLALTIAISCDNFAGGFASAIAVAFMSALVNRQFSATQYAAFTSITVLLPKLIAGYAGTIVDSVGYSYFFAITAFMGIPAIALIYYYKAVYTKLIQQ